MLTKLRENIYVSDRETTIDQLKEAGVTAILVTDYQMVAFPITPDFINFEVDLRLDRVNKPHVKDIACHIPKYMAQNGETIAIIDATGLKQAVYVAARAICELENRSIYEVFVELKELLPGFDINGAYL